MEWFERYRNKLGVRLDTFELLFRNATERGLKNVVETGTARGKYKFYYFKPKLNWDDGMSTIMFANYSKVIKGNFWSCDIDKKNIKNAQKFLQDYNLSGNLIVSDSLEFLNDFDKTIDILYLDSLDGQMPGSNEHQLKEAQISINKMNPKGLIMLDDKGQKTELSLSFYIEKSWEVKFETDYQIILQKKM